MGLTEWPAPDGLVQPGQNVVVPVVFHSAVAIASSAFIFPTSVAAQYTASLRAVIGPLSSGFRQHLALLEISPSSPDFSPKAVRASASTAENALAPLAASVRLLRCDISWGRFSGKDLDGMREKVQRLVMRAHGMNVYFSLTDPTRERFPVTPAPSRSGSPSAGTPNVSSPSSSTRTEESLDASSTRLHSATVYSQPGVERHRGRTASQRHPHFDISSLSHPAKSHLHRALFRRRHHRHPYISSLSGVHHHDNLREHVVGVFESQRYLDLESHHFAHPQAIHYTERSTVLLRQSCEPLLRSCDMGLGELDRWLRTSRHKRWMFWWGGDKCFDVQQERLNALYRAHDELTRALETFRTSLRFVILNLWLFLTTFTDIWFWNRIGRLLATSM
jgi:Putative ER transporter, 6TM, N-terminal